MRAHAIAAIFFSFAVFTVSAGQQNTVSGTWDATVVVNEMPVPFRIAFSEEGNSLQGWFFNGDDQITATSGTFHDGRIILRFDHYGTALDAKLVDGRLEGTYKRAGRTPYTFQAVRSPRRPVAAKGTAPDISGQWEIAVQSPKGKSAWHLVVRQDGIEARAAILRVDGDTGTLTGSYVDGRFILSHFSGARPAVLILTPAADGSLDIELTGRGTYMALRPAVARAKGLAGPADPGEHTSVRNGSETFRFRFPDLAGRDVTESDPRFQGKVVLVNITGSWCPNCHDEAPFLASLYRQYRERGLEVVAISFEEEEQLRDPVRLRAFIKKYGIDYTVLTGGQPSELAAKLPQAVNLNSWPTTFFIGRDGRVRHVHAGFAGKASGNLHDETVRTITRNVEGLLSETQQSPRP